MAFCARISASGASVALLFALAASFGIACQGSTRESAEPPASPSSPVGEGGLPPSSALAAPSAGPTAVAGAAAGAAGATSVGKPTPDVTVGHLEHPARLLRLFERLADLEAKKAPADVRVLQLGDSHTASDYGTSVLRQKLTARFGDGGRGFLPVGEPYKRLFQAGELVSAGVDFRPEEARPSGKGDGRYGLGGIAMIGGKPTSRVNGQYAVNAASLEIAYLDQPGGGSFDVIVDGKSLARVETRRSVPQSAFRLFDVEDKPHRIELHARGDGDVRLYGIAMDERVNGIVVDSLGINGAKATDPLGWDESHVREQLRHRAPALVIFAYGTNECSDATTPDDHERAFVELVGRLERAGVGGSCLLLGPPDRASRTDKGWATMPKLAPLIAAQRRAADRAGCAFFDQLSAMGGPGSIHAWAGEPKPRARQDHVHFTRDGYTVLATDLAADLVGAYEAWKASR